MRPFCGLLPVYRCGSLLVAFHREEPAMTSEIAHGCRGPGLDGNPCDHPPARHGQELCWGHLRQLSRRGRLVPIREVRTPFDKVVDAGSALLEADSEDDAAFEFLKHRFFDACTLWMKSRGWRQPEPAPTPAEFDGWRNLPRAVHAPGDVGSMSDSAAATVDPHEALRAALLEGHSVAAAAKLAGLSERSAYRWLGEHRMELFATALRASPAMRFIGRPGIAGIPMLSRPRAAR